MLSSPWLLALRLAGCSWAAAALRAHELVAFHRQLVEMESVSGNETAVAQWLVESLQGQGYRVEKQHLPAQRERFNVYAWPGRSRHAAVVLTSHLDTVPPFLPYTYREAAGGATVGGRGSVDAKASVAAQVVAVNRLVAAGQVGADDVALLFVVGEEVGGDGMRAANGLGLRPAAVVFGEPTAGRLVSGHKGTAQVVLTAKGKTAHSAYPWLGRSANEILVCALHAVMQLADALPASDKYGSTTFNLGRIEGGVAGNVVAESARATITVRIAAGEPEHVERALTHAVHRAVRPFLHHRLAPEDVIDIDFGPRGYGPVDIDADVPGFAVATVNYGTDIPYWNKTSAHQKLYLYGPGSIFVAHGDHESLAVQDLETAVDGYQKIVLHVLGKSEAARQDL